MDVIRLIQSIDPFAPLRRSGELMARSGDCNWRHRPAAMHETHAGRFAHQIANLGPETTLSGCGSDLAMGGAPSH